MAEAQEGVGGLSRGGLMCSCLGDKTSVERSWAHVPQHAWSIGSMPYREVPVQVQTPEIPWLSV